MLSCSPVSLENAAARYGKNAHRDLQIMKAYLWCQLANQGGFKPPGSLPLLTGFSLVPGATGTSAIAVWAVPPAAATATELWTSPDNITFSLDSTNPVPSVGNSTAAPAVGSFKWAKARYVNATIQGPFCAAQEVSGRVCDWAKRVVANGGANTTLTERTAANTYDLALVSAGISGNMIYELLLISSSFIGATTPLYKVAGNDPATNHNFVAGDLTINGLAGDGTTKFLDPGINAQTQWPLNGGVSPGLAAYQVTFNNGANVAIGVANGGGSLYLQVDDASGNSNSSNPGASSIVSVANTLWTGYVAGERISATRQDLYKANSTTAFASIGNDSTNQGTGSTVTQATGGIFFFAFQLNGAASNFDAQRKSFLSMHNGLTSSQTQAHFNAVQAFRVALGGGSV